MKTLTFALAMAGMMVTASASDEPEPRCRYTEKGDYICSFAPQIPCGLIQRNPPETAELICKGAIADLDNKDRNMDGGDFRTIGEALADTLHPSERNVVPKHVLMNAFFLDLSMRNTTFDGMDLTDAQFQDIDLTGASFRNAILTRTGFPGSNLASVDFAGARIVPRGQNRTWFDGATNCPRVIAALCNR